MIVGTCTFPLPSPAFDSLQAERFAAVLLIGRSCISSNNQTSVILGLVRDSIHKCWNEDLFRRDYSEVFTRRAPRVSIAKLMNGCGLSQ